ncbi:RtcB family protein, partial [candidate division WOR-3 bacterium]|nr:RtcB family protein [candidate division WOR-3 bacterium]
NMTFSSTCHGSGRVLSRHKAIKATKGIDLQKTLEESGIKVIAKSWKTLHEEASIAYKNISDVIDSVDGAGICQKVAKLIPIGVIKG